VSSSPHLHHSIGWPLARSRGVNRLPQKLAESITATPTWMSRKCSYFLGAHNVGDRECRINRDLWDTAITLVPTTSARQSHLSTRLLKNHWEREKIGVSVVNALRRWLLMWRQKKSAAGELKGDILAITIGTCWWLPHFCQKFASPLEKKKNNESFSHHQARHFWTIDDIAFPSGFIGIVKF
jgi:hypothetical protein